MQVCWGIPLTFVRPLDISFKFPEPVTADLASGGGLWATPHQAQHGEDYLKRAQAHAKRCGLDLVTAAARVDDPRLKAADEWRADVAAYAKAIAGVRVSLG